MLRIVSMWKTFLRHEIAEHWLESRSCCSSFFSLIFSHPIFFAVNPLGLLSMYPNDTENCGCVSLPIGNSNVARERERERAHIRNTIRDIRVVNENSDV